MKHRLKQAIENISTLMRYIFGSETLTFHPGTRLERQKKITIFWVVFVVVILLSIVLYFYLSWNKYYMHILNNNVEDFHWLGFIGGFWGAIIGAIISGVATILTTWLIIRRSYRIDYHRERIESLPVLQLTVRKDIEKEVKNAKRMKDIIHKYKIWNREWIELPDEFTVFEIKNIGKGIAIQPKVSNEAEEAVFGAPSFSSIGSLESAYFLEELHYIYNSEIVFSFFDIFENYYEQSFSLEVDDEGKIWNITLTIPKLVMKTQRIRYEQ